MGRVVFRLFLEPLRFSGGEGRKTEALPGPTARQAAFIGRSHCTPLGFSHALGSVSEQSPHGPTRSSSFLHVIVYGSPGGYPFLGVPISEETWAFGVPCGGGDGTVWLWFSWAHQLAAGNFDHGRVGKSVSKRGPDFAALGVC